MQIVLDGKFCFKEGPWLTWSDIKYGLEKGHISVDELIKYAILSLDINSSELHYDLASLNNFNENEVIMKIDSLIKKEKLKINNSKEKWIFLVLLYLYQNRGKYNDPLVAVEEIYADFNYPESIAPIVRYMPSEDLSSKREVNLLERWRDLLETMRAKILSATD
jgi:hypothetical protein